MTGIHRNNLYNIIIYYEKSLWNKGRTSIQGKALYVRSVRPNTPDT